MRYTASVRKKPDGSGVMLYFWVTIGSTGWSMLKPFSSWVMKVLSVAKAHVRVLSGGLQPLQLVCPWCPSWRQVTGPEFLHQLGTNFSTYITTMDWHQDSVQHAVQGLCE